MNISELSFPMQIVVWILIGCLLFIQSTLIFISARKRGANAWFWGFIGLLNIPSGAILYYIFVIFPDRKRREKNG